MKKIISIIIGLIILISSFSSILMARAEDEVDGLFPAGGNTKELEKIMEEAEAKAEAETEAETEAEADKIDAENEKLLENEDKEEECQEKFGTSCKAAEALKKTPTDLTEGTFPVNEVLRLDNGEQPKKYFNDPENASPIVAFIVEIIDFATIIMGSIAVILFIVAGFMFMFAYGNQQTVDKAKEVVTYGVIGLAVTFLSYIIVIAVQSIFIAD